MSTPIDYLAKSKRFAVLSAALLLSNFSWTAAPGATTSSPQEQPKPAAPQDSIVMRAMEKELDRSISKLKHAGSAPIYFIAYRVGDDQSLTLVSSFGATETVPEIEHHRYLSVELRAGSPKLDSSHSAHTGGYAYFRQHVPAPIEDDENALRACLWDQTDMAFKNAQESLKSIQTAKDILLPEEDQSDDFSVEKPQKYTGPQQNFQLDINAWQERLKKASSIYKKYPKIIDSKVELRASKIRRYLVSTEGTKIEDETMQYNVFTVASATADDGMLVWLYDHVEMPSAKDLPDDKKLSEMVQKLATSVMQLREARVAEPFAGPVILRPKAAGVFFHEVFGHRAEGHRQKSEYEGRTFTKLVGKKIMPSFISVRDDPTTPKLAGTPLNGYYRYDDEGVPAQNVVLVDHGVLKTFLLGRSPIKGFNHSNGHCRTSLGLDPVVRQGNLIIESSRQVPYSQLRQMLIAEIKRQHKPYGLIFDEIAGGFTMTHMWMPQVFKLLPLRVYRVYADGKPDELLRGVSIIGTPLASLETIMCAANDCGTFNGNCGAESGWVPVSATSPSLLLRTLEVERNFRQRSKPPLLPPPTKEPKK